MIKWEVIIIELRRIPNLNIADTKFFDSKEEAIGQFEDRYKFFYPKPINLNSTLRCTI